MKARNFANELAETKMLRDFSKNVKVLARWDENYREISLDSDDSKTYWNYL